MNHGETTVRCLILNPEQGPFNAMASSLQIALLILLLVPGDTIPSLVPRYIFHRTKNDLTPLDHTLARKA